MAGDGHIPAIADTPCVAAMLRMFDLEAGLEEAMPEDIQVEHRSTEHDWLPKVGSRLFDVLDDVGRLGCNQPLTHGSNEVGVLLACAPARRSLREDLAWGRAMDGIETVKREGEGIGLVKLKRVIRLWVEVDAHHLKAGEVIAHGGAASLAAQVKKALHIMSQDRGGGSGRE